jgi:hypothetical protein
MHIALASALVSYTWLYLVLFSLSHQLSVKLGSLFTLLGQGKPALDSPCTARPHALRPTFCPGRNLPCLAVKRPARAYKSTQHKTGLLWITPRRLKK